MIIAFFSFCYCDKISWQRSLKRERVQLAHSSWWHHCRQVTVAGREGSGHSPSRQELWHPVWYWIDAHVLEGIAHFSMFIPGSPIRGRMWGRGRECLSIAVDIKLVPTDMATGQPDPDSLSLKIPSQVTLDVSSWQWKRITVLWHIFSYCYNYCSSDSYLKYDLYINKSLWHL